MKAFSWSYVARGGLLVLALGALPLACDTSGLVGGDCRTGLSDCAGRCVDLQGDRANCGACANACAPGVACSAGICGGDAGVDDGGRDGSADSSVDAPTDATGDAVTDAPSDALSDAPSDALSDVVTDAPSDAPTDAPTDAPSDAPTDAPTDAGDAGSDASSDAGDAGSDASSDAGSDASSDAGDAGDACTPPFDTAAQCGDCFTTCTGAEPICAPSDGGFACAPFCTAPLVECSGRCVDTQTDPDNCGYCNHRCVTRICQAGSCVGSRVGHIVAMCMDLDVSPTDSMQTLLLSNALVLPPGFGSVNVLAWTQFAAPAHIQDVNDAIAAATVIQGRSFSVTPETDYTAIPAQLNVASFQVLLVYEQSLAASGELASAGAALNASIDSFTRGGGVVIALSRGAGEMDALLTQSGVLPVTSHTEVTGQLLFNRAPGDAVGLNVLSPFFAPRTSCTFQTSVTPGPFEVFVIRDNDAPLVGEPTVVHRIRRP